ncbi:MAG: glycosyltransferase family 4 protein [Acidimicrobiales bacterium]|nr:glycosyltransferase family 4 protein [Acidimicrobiales bacterium]MYB80428.1 glycosyltransferase family 4 protein [Acidimicrobiales bacterium]MYI14103.1 glycosyltransferase family 4 protein [Acidimicrobiales bacterium]
MQSRLHAHDAAHQPCPASPAHLAPSRHPAERTGVPASHPERRRHGSKQDRCETGRVRVALVAPGFPTSLDDHHKPFLLDHARALAGAGAEVTVVCPAHPDAPRRHVVGGIEVHRVRFAPRRIEARVALGESYRVFSGLSALWVVPMIARLTLAAALQARRRSADGTVIHGHWWFPCGLVAVAAAALAGRRTASVVHIHGSDAAVTTNAIHRWLARRVLRRASAVVTVSEDLQDWASSLVRRSRGPHPPPSAEPSGRTGGPLLAVASMPVGADRLGTPTPAPADGPVIGIGRLMAEKGFDVLIEAVALMPPAAQPELVIVGDGPDLTLLEALALRRGVSAEFAGAVPPNEIGEWYRRARLVCVPSRREGFGMITAEALAAGRPVVATAVGAAPHFITEGANGFLAPPDSADALAAVLTKALQTELAASASTTAVTLAPFGAEAHAAALMEIYGQIVQP